MEEGRWRRGGGVEEGRWRRGGGGEEEGGRRGGIAAQTFDRVWLSVRSLWKGGPTPPPVTGVVQRAEQRRLKLQRFDERQASAQHDDVLLDHARRAASELSTHKKFVSLATKEYVRDLLSDIRIVMTQSALDRLVEWDGDHGAEEDGVEVRAFRGWRGVDWFSWVERNREGDEKGNHARGSSRLGGGSGTGAGRRERWSGALVVDPRQRNARVAPRTTA